MRAFRAVVGMGVWVASWALGAPANTSAASPRPSIVLILADDLGYGDIGCYGAPDVRTPNLDRLAAQGVRLTRFYANAPECTPTRTALLTGRYPQRVGGLECAIGVGNVGRYDDAIRLAGRHALGLPAGEAVLPAALAARGYTTAIFGKWHLGYEPEFRPTRHGWDRFFGVLGGNMDYFRHREQSPLPVLYEGTRPVDREGYATHLFTDAAVRFLRERGGDDRPFLLYVPYTAPHTPVQPPDDPGKPITDENWNRGTRAEYAAVIEDLDSQIGRILATLDAMPPAGEVVVIFASDNGGTALANNGPFRGTKGTLFEGGIRVPCVVRAPGRIVPGTESDRPGLTMGLTASILALAGAEPPADRPPDGIDLLGQLAAGVAPPDRPMFWRYRRGTQTWRAARIGTLKFVERDDGDQVERWLFDLARDPVEADNLLDRRPDDAARLRTHLAAWEAEVAPAR